MEAVWELATGPLAAALPLALALATLSCALIALPVLRLAWRSEAEKTAGALLLEMVSEEQKRQMARFGCLTVRSPAVSDRVYLIPVKRGMVQMYESGRLTAVLCVEPTEWTPRGDVVLMHKLMIEGNEEAYLRTANIRPESEWNEPFSLPGHLAAAIGRVRRVR
jgi:hypothetical protein